MLITVGSGGVGKTTIAATLALRAAMEGKGSLVLHHRPGASAWPTRSGSSSWATPRRAFPDESFAKVGLAPTRRCTR